MENRCHRQRSLERGRRHRDCTKTAFETRHVRCRLTSSDSSSGTAQTARPAATSRTSCKSNVLHKHKGKDRVDPRPHPFYDYEDTSCATRGHTYARFGRCRPASAAHTCAHQRNILLNMHCKIARMRSHKHASTRAHEYTMALGTLPSPAPTPDPFHCSPSIGPAASRRHAHKVCNVISLRGSTKIRRLIATPHWIGTAHKTRTCAYDTMR